MKQQKPILHGRDHAPGGADPIPGLFPSGDTLDSLILAAAPAGFWKLDELAGTVAFDSSGNGQHLTTTGAARVWTTPLWASPGDPPPAGDAVPAPSFEVGTGGVGGNAARLEHAWPALAADFTASIFFQPDAAAPPNNQTMLMGQGAPGRPGYPGWALMVSSEYDGFVAHSYIELYVGSGPVKIMALNSLPEDAGSRPWLMATVVYVADGDLFRLYVDGLLQTEVPVAAYSPTGNPLWIGHDGGGSAGEFAITVPQFRGSYAFLVNRAMSGAELRKIFLTPEETGPTSGLVVNGSVPENTVTPKPTPPPAATERPPEDGLDWINDQPFVYDGPDFEVPPNKWTTIPFTTPVMTRESNMPAPIGETAWTDIPLGDPDGAGWVKASDPHAITIPHDMPFWGHPVDWYQVCLRMETPPVEEFTSRRGLRIFETTRQKWLLVTYDRRDLCTRGGGGINVYRQGGTVSQPWFANGDTGGTGTHDAIMFEPNSESTGYIAAPDWLPKAPNGDPMLKKGMRLVAQVWHDATVPLTFHCSRAGATDYRPHFVVIQAVERDWGPPWSEWPEP